MYRFRLLMIAGFVSAPVWGQPRQWVDDFQTAATYDTRSLYGPCFGHPPTKYTLVEFYTGYIYEKQAVSGGGLLRVSNSTMRNDLGLGRMEMTILGWFGFGLGCPQEPPIGQSTESFTSDDVCVYGGFRIGASQSDVTWGVMLKGSVETGTGVYLNIEPDSHPSEYNLDLFSLREFDEGLNQCLEAPDEIDATGFHIPDTDYNYVFCVSGGTYGAMLWTGSDMANPDETLGPVVPSFEHCEYNNLVALLNEPPSTELPGGDGMLKTVTGTFTDAIHRGNTNFRNKFWVISGSSNIYHPAPWPDLDGDRDVDGFDFLTFSNCYNGSNRPALPTCVSTYADLDGDGDVDGFDFLTFSNCYNGSNRPSPACLPPDLTPACEYGQAAKLLASDGAAQDMFGSDTDLWCGTALIGAQGNTDNGPSSGSAYVFRYDGSRWAQQTELLPSDGVAGDAFGCSVAVASYVGGVYTHTPLQAVIGASGDDDKDAQSGSAYVFRYNLGPPSVWQQEAKLLASDGAAGDYFGCSVSASGDHAVIGANNDNDKGTRSGSAYVFWYNGSNWLQGAKLLASDGAAYDYFGTSVATYGNVAVIGAHGDDDRGTMSGSAYVFRSHSTSSWPQEAKLLASDGAAEDLFGLSVAIFGDVIVVGAPKSDEYTNPGSAYVFRYNGSSWVQEAKLVASDGAGCNQFGYCLDVWNDLIVIGAHRDDDNGTNSGAAYVFQYNGSNWVQQAKLFPSDGSAGDFFGSPAVSGGTVLVGAWGDDDLGISSGSAYVFRCR